MADPQQDYEAGVAAFDRNDMIVAMQLLRGAADAGHAGAQVRYGYILDKAEEDEEARRYYGMAAEQGDIEGILNLASHLISGEGGPVDLEAARRWLQRGADLGSDAAARRLAELQ